MTGAVMWEQEGRERYDASIVRFIEADGRVNVVFSNTGCLRFMAGVICIVIDSGFVFQFQQTRIYR